MSSSMTAPSTRVPFLFLITFVLFSNLITATCYWQNSTLAPNDPYSIATDDTACFPSQQNSPCCGTGWSCLSDGVCYIRQGSNEFYYRGTCTDKTWGSQQCPGWCFAQNSNTSIPLAKCKKSTGEDWYCCPGDPGCDCDSGKFAIKLGASQPVTVTVVGSTSWPGMMSTSTPVTAGDINVAATKLSTSAPSNTAAASSGTNPALAAGLGAGIGIALLLLGIGAFVLIQRARRLRSTVAHSLQSKADFYNNPPSYKGDKGYYATAAIHEIARTKTWDKIELDAARTPLTGHEAELP